MSQDQSWPAYRARSREIRPVLQPVRWAWGFVILALPGVVAPFLPWSANLVLRRHVYAWEQAHHGSIGVCVGLVVLAVCIGLHWLGVAMAWWRPISPRRDGPADRPLRTAAIISLLIALGPTMVGVFELVGRREYDRPLIGLWLELSTGLALMVFSALAVWLGYRRDLADERALYAAVEARREQAPRREPEQRDSR